MAGVQGVALAAAVREAGGLGSLPAAMLGPDTLHDALTELQAGAAGPYNVNFFCHTSPKPDLTQDAHWRDALKPYYDELGIDPAISRIGPARKPFDAAAGELLAQFRPAVVSFHFGLPEASLIALARSWGAKVLSTATTVDEARWLESQGVDGVIAQGWEAGGHRGSFLSDDMNLQLGTFALVPQIVQAVNVPVIAAGGIADAAGVDAALRLGAAAVQVGTAYLLCPESTTSPVHRAALLSDESRRTAVTNLFSGRPARGIVNRLMRELGPMSNLPPPFPLAAAALAPLRERAEAQGRGDFSPLWAGQNVSGCRAIPAADLTRELAHLL